MRVDADVAIVGSGFAGSLTALALRSRGKRVALIERGRHPRFAIGESSTPLANLLLEQIADEYELPQVRVFSKWGTWQRARPDVAGGIKRGFTFYFHKPGEPFVDDARRDRQMMVAASPHDGVADTHWYRPDFDRNLAHEAEAAGAVYLDQMTVERVAFNGAGVRLEGSRAGQPVRVEASFVVDASGPRGLLARTLDLQASPLQWLPPTIGLYTHFEHVARWDASHESVAAPYPPDDAAVHHVFPGGWIWMLRFNNGITSAGAALLNSVERGVRGQADTTPGLAWDDLLQSLPSVHDQFADARVVHPWMRGSPLAFRTRRVAGANWALLPSAAGVIDPLLSTGFPLTLLGIRRILNLLDAGTTEPALRDYERITLAELDATEQLVAALYACMGDPALFKRLTLLYFAAASFSEAARRLNRPELAPGFLLHAHATFGPELERCCDIARAHPQGRAREDLLSRIERVIEPFDIARLGDRSRADWYPVLADDLIANASKLHASRADIELLLERSGFAGGVHT